MDYKKLVNAAIKARRNSFSPYSRFRVGAAVLTKSGRVFSGCNIENSSYSLTICAERNALFKAISEGQKHFKALAIVSDINEFLPPCGACRQVIMDLAGNIDIIMTKGGNTQQVTKMSALLPYPFTRSFLQRK